MCDLEQIDAGSTEETIRNGVSLRRRNLSRFRAFAGMINMLGAEWAKPM
jgi:hypothetical protein